MKILILDDQEIIVDPPDRSLTLYPDRDPRQHTIVQVLAREDFIYEIRTSHWDEVWIDHDLGIDNDIWDGKKATLWISNHTHEYGKLDVDLFRIITMNASRGLDMLRDVEKVGYEAVQTPFSTLTDFRRGDFLWLKNQ